MLHDPPTPHGDGPASPPAPVERNEATYVTSSAAHPAYVPRHIFQLNRRFLAGPGSCLRPRSPLNRYPETVITHRAKQQAPPLGVRGAGAAMSE